MSKGKKIARTQLTKLGNKTAHFRAKLNPEVKVLIGMLRNGKGTLGPVELGQRIKNLISFGCSRRGLAEDIGVSPTSIRRYIEISGLPEKELKAIQSGASAKRILSLKATAARQNRSQQRVEEDRKTGRLSDEIVTVIMELCRSCKGLVESSYIKRDVSSVLRIAKRSLSQFEALGRRESRASKKLELKALFKATRPRLREGTATLTHLGEWLAEVLWVIVPDAPIRESALAKVESRATEIAPKRTPLESWYAARAKSEMRVRDLSHLPAREIYPGGAREYMQRQGPAAEPPDAKRPRRTRSKS